MCVHGENLSDREGHQNSPPLAADLAAINSTKALSSNRCKWERVYAVKSPRDSEVHPSWIRTFVTYIGHRSIFSGNVVDVHQLPAHKKIVIRKDNHRKRRKKSTNQSRAIQKLCPTSSVLLEILLDSVASRNADSNDVRQVPHRCRKSRFQVVWSPNF